MNNDTLSKDLWTVANGIVAFVALQEVAFSVVVVQHGSLPGLSSRQQFVGAILLSVAFLFYSIAAWYCGRKSIELASPADTTRDKIMKAVNWARVGFIAFVGIVTVLIVFWNKFQ